MPSLDAAARPPLLTTIDEGLDTGQRDPPSMATVSTVRSCRTLCARERIRIQAREVVQQETPANCYPTPRSRLLTATTTCCRYRAQTHWGS